MPTSSWCCLTSGRSPRSSVFLFHLLLHLRKSLPRGSQWHDKEMSPSLLPGKAGLQLSVGYNVTPPTLTSLFFFPFYFHYPFILYFASASYFHPTISNSLDLPPHTHTHTVQYSAEMQGTSSDSSKKVWKSSRSWRRLRESMRNKDKVEGKKRTSWKLWLG